MTTITIAVNVVELNIHNIKIMRLYNLLDIVRTENQILSSYIYCLLEKHGVPLSAPVEGLYQIDRGQLYRGNSEDGTPFYRWTDEGDGGMLV